MPIDFSFRRQALRDLTTKTGVYILADLDGTPVYVGKSRDGIRARVQRHLTSARSDVIANRQIDVWEIAYVWAYPEPDKGETDTLEGALFHHFHSESRLMNGQMPAVPPKGYVVPEPAQIVQVMSDEEIAERVDPELRLPRQAQHYAQLVDHFVTVKNSKQVAGAMDAHFERLRKYHAQMLGASSDEE